MPSVLPANAQTVWDDLIAAGATPVQAAGIMGNMLHETIDLSPEVVAMDTNGAYSRGLVMWNDAGAGAGVNWSQYITGNIPADTRAQVGLIVAQGGLGKAAGPDAYTAGVNFAHTFEACAECGYQGSSQLPQRGASATTVLQVAQSGNWSLGGGLAPLGQSPTTPGASAAPVTETAFNPLQFGPLGEIQNIFAGLVQSGVKGPEKVYQGVTHLLAALLAGETWIRLAEVVGGVIVASAGVALVAVTLASAHPGAVADVAALIPGEGAVARGAVGATRAATTGSAVRAAAGGVSGARAGRRVTSARRAAPAPRPRGATTAGAGRQVRAATTAAAGTARRAQGRTPRPRAGSTTRPRPQGGPTIYGPEQTARRRAMGQSTTARPMPAGPDPDDERYAAAKRAGRENRAYYRREMRGRRRDTSDLRRRTP